MNLAPISGLATPQGRRGVEVALDGGVDPERSIVAAIAAVRVDRHSRAGERSAAVATAFAEGSSGRPLVVRVWDAGHALRVELTNPPELFPDDLELLERFTDRWGLIELDERTIWFEVARAPGAG